MSWNWDFTDYFELESEHHLAHWLCSSFQNILNTTHHPHLGHNSNFTYYLALFATDLYFGILPLNWSHPTSFE